MIIQIILTVVAFICAALIAYALTPSVRVLAFKIGAIDVPLNSRRVHKKPIPRIGGLAIYISFLITTAIFGDFSKTLITVWIGGGVLVLTGIIDDIFRLNAWIKLFIQIVTAIFAVLNGMQIEGVYLGEYYSLGVFSIPLTIFWIVGLTNAINLIDGLDGLACGITAIGTGSLFLVVLLKGDYINAVIFAIMLGSCLGFLPFNTNPARIFMGDTGALFLGYAMAIFSISGTFKLHTMLSFLIPIIIFAIPIFDTLFSIIRRLIKKQSPFKPDRGHIHHKLLDMGFTQKETVNILYCSCGIMGLVAVCFTEILPETGKIVKVIAIAIIALILLVLNYNILKNPYGRKHSGLIENDMTIEEYLNEIGEEKAKKIIKHNGGNADDYKKIDENKKE